MTPKEAALLMKSLLDENDRLYQSEAADELMQIDNQLADYDDEGNLCIDKTVLAEFRKITPDVVYVRSEKMWRPREEYDLPGRQQ